MRLRDGRRRFFDDSRRQISERKKALDTLRKQFHAGRFNRLRCRKSFRLKKGFDWIPIYAAPPNNFSMNLIWIFNIPFSNSGDLPFPNLVHRLKAF